MRMTEVTIQRYEIPTDFYTYFLTFLPELFISKSEKNRQDNSNKFSLAMQKGAIILCVQMQRVWKGPEQGWQDRPYIWAMVDPNNEVEPRNFRLIGTGQSLDQSEMERLRYIGSIQVSSTLVAHLFEEGIRQVAIHGKPPIKKREGLA